MVQKVQPTYYMGFILRLAIGLIEADNFAIRLGLMEGMTDRRHRQIIEGDHYQQLQQILIIYMNITRLNFKEVFPSLLNAITEANFVAIDFEMSGIISAFTLDPSLTDSIQMRYYKTKCKAERFIPLQLGICPLKIEPTKVVYSPFNIYLYPLALSEKDAEEFSFNSESMRFLAKNKFDFNQLFYEGVPFVSLQKIRRHELKLQQLKEREEQSRQYMLQSPGVAAFLNLKLEEVTKWISLESGSQAPPEAKQIYVDIQFVRLRAYQSLIYLIQKKYPSLSLSFEYLDVNKNALEDSNFLSRKYLRIRKIPSEQQQGSIDSSTQVPQNSASSQPKKGRQKSIGNEVECLAVNQIWETIKTKQIPLVVHNGFLDLMHCYHRFIGDLPSDEAAYRKGISASFPLIYDTKYICNSSPVLFNKLNRDTSLGNCYKILRMDQQEKSINKENSTSNQLVASEISAICKEYKFDQEEHHEAGYDALMTAYTFVNAMKELHYWPQNMLKPEFHRKVQYYGNKVPLGNIRVPFDFTGKNQEYEADGGKQFYFTCLQNKKSVELAETFLAKEVEIYNHFTNKYGAVKIMWEDRNKYNFTMSFLRSEDEAKFSSVLDSLGYALYSIENEDRYLISTRLIESKKLVTGQNKT